MAKIALKLTAYANGGNEETPLYVNPLHVVAVCSEVAGTSQTGRTVVLTTAGVTYFVKETPDEVVDLAEKVVMES